MSYMHVHLHPGCLCIPAGFMGSVADRPPPFPLLCCSWGALFRCGEEEGREKMRIFQFLIPITFYTLTATSCSPHSERLKWSDTTSKSSPHYQQQHKCCVFLSFLDVMAWINRTKKRRSCQHNLIHYLFRSVQIIWLFYDAPRRTKGDRKRKEC